MARLSNGTTDIVFATVSTAGGPQPSGGFTMVIWFKSTSGTTNKVFFGCGRNSSTNGRYFLGSLTAGTGMRIVVINVSGTAILNSALSATVLDGVWHHLAFTLTSAGNWVVYVDGAVDISGGAIGGTSWTNDRTFMHGQNAGGSSAFQSACTLADGALWARALTINEVQTLAAGVSPLLLGPEHYWPEFGADSPEPDLGNVTHGTAAVTGTTRVDGNHVLAPLTLGRT